MKKIVSLLAVVIASITGFAQTATVSPANFTAEDQITITFDLNGVQLGNNGEDVYIWGFVPGCCGSPLNDQGGFGFGNSNPLAKCTALGGKKYSFTLTPTQYMNKTAAEIGAQFGCLAKNQNGSRQTQDFVFAVDPLTFTPSVFRPFPSKFTQDDVVTFYLDKNLLDPSKTALKAATEVYVFTDIDYVRPNGTTGYFQVSQYCEPLNTSDGNYYPGQTTTADNPALKAKDFGNGLFGWTIVPSKFFRIGDTGSPLFPPAGSRITRIKVHFRTRLSPYCPFTSGDSGSLGDNFGFPVTQ
ncbi:hypothetical protein ACFOWM_04475 [Ferruginibacter yonginensis]|uniref:Uncharacterized protein n=1 Tax=Ferruginibacter yonginensis TaxID=1310416 RepID=A0ABV8QQU6_9BACT